MLMNEADVRIALAGEVVLDASLTIPASVLACVAFAHGSGSSRHSPRNRLVATTLNEGGLATLLLDLLTPEEEAIDRLTARLRFDVDLLATRLVAATGWLRAQARLAMLPLGYFGASTGAAAALIAAAELPGEVAAVVSRGGRPDLVAQRLARVRAPTLLIVGGDDTTVLELNRQALASMTAERELVVIPHATHLFEEPGALEGVAQLSRAWFLRFSARPH
jgi:putative phosphoribosyl transferase